MNFTLPTWLVATASTYLTTRTAATLLNLFFWYRSPDDWAGFVESSPKLALAVRISRAWGIDWRKTLRLIRTFTTTFRKQGVPFPEAEDPPTVPERGPAKSMDPPAPLVPKDLP